MYTVQNTTSNLIVGYLASGSLRAIHRRPEMPAVFVKHVSPNKVCDAVYIISF